MGRNVKNKTRRLGWGRKTEVGECSSKTISQFLMAEIQQCCCTVAPAYESRRRVLGWVLRKARLKYYKLLIDGSNSGDIIG